MELKDPIRLYAVLLPREEMESAVAHLPKDEPIVVRLTEALERTKQEQAPTSRS